MEIDYREFTELAGELESTEEATGNIGHDLARGYARRKVGRGMSLMDWDRAGGVDPEEERARADAQYEAMLEEQAEIQMADEQYEFLFGKEGGEHETEP